VQKLLFAFQPIHSTRATVDLHMAASYGSFFRQAHGWIGSVVG